MKKILLSILILIFYINSNAQSPLRINKFLIDTLVSGVWYIYHDTLHNGSWRQLGSGGGGGAGTVTSVGQTFTGGLISVAGSPITTSGTLALTVAGTSGGVPYFSSTSTWASSGLLAANALMIGGGAGAAPSTTTTGTGVLTALGINVGSAGAFVTFNGAGGTPSAITLTNGTGLPPTTGILGWPANSAGVLTNDGAGTLSWGSSSVTWNGISNPTADQALTFDAGESSTWTDANTTEDLFTVTSSTGTTNSLVSLNRTGTALAAGNNIMELVSSGANGTNAITATGLNISVTNTNATSGTNTGIAIAASGATTANYAINVSAGQTRLPAGTGSIPAIIFANGAGLFDPTGTEIGIHGGTIERARIGQNGLLFRENTAVIDIGNAGSLGGTNRIRISAPAVGSMQLGMESTQQSMVFKGANNAGTDAAGFNMTYQPGAGTGNSTSAGTLIFSTPDAAGSGTTVQSYTTKFTVGRFGGVWASRNAEVQGADVASVAGAIAVGTDGNAFEITGTNAITLISNLNWQNGAVITLAFTSTATLTDGTANSGTDIGMELAGNTNFVGSAGATLTLRLLEIGGTQRWREVARSVQ